MDFFILPGSIYLEQAKEKLPKHTSLQIQFLTWHLFYFCSNHE